MIFSFTLSPCPCTRSIYILQGPKHLEGNCSSKLTIKDGIDSKNEILLGSYCDSDLPKLCDHKALQNETRVVRSCVEGESYISAGPRLIIEQNFHEVSIRPPIIIISPFICISIKHLMIIIRALLFDP